MKRWRIWLRRTAWLSMGLVLMSGSVGISAKANNMPGNKPVEATESPGDMETDAAENTDQSTNLNVPGTLTIAGFDDLPEDVLLQDISSEDAGAAPYLPESLSVDVYVGTPEEEKAAANSYSILKAVLSVSKTLTSEKETREIDGLQWKIEPSGSLYSEFKLESGAYYAYTPVFPETDGEGNKIVLGDKAKNEIPGIIVLVDGGPTEDIDDGMNLAAAGSGNGSDDVEDGYLSTITFCGIVINGPDNTHNVKTDSNRVFLKEPGRYVFQGQGKDWIAPPLDETPTNSLIEFEGEGKYEIELNGVNIDIDGLGYGSIFSISNKTTVELYTVTGSKSSLFSSLTSSSQKVVVNKGTFKMVSKASLDLQGQFTNDGELIVEGQSRLKLNGDITNSKNVVIKDSSAVETNIFTNSGTLTINERNELNDASSLIANGGIKNSGKVVLDDGKLTLNTLTKTETGIDGNTETTTYVGKLENSGSVDIVNGSEVLAVETVNNSGGTLKVDKSILTLTEVLDNGGKFTVDNSGKVNASTLNNSGNLVIGSNRDSSSEVNLKGGTGDQNKNTGTITIEDGSVLATSSGGDATLVSSGTIKIKGLECLGVEGTNGIMLTPEGEGAQFILDGLGNGMIRLKDIDTTSGERFELDYTGNPQDALVIGENGVVERLDEYEHHGAKFQVVAPIELGTIEVYRKGRAASSGDPGITEAADANANYTKDVTAEGIWEPGDYTLTYINKNNDRQTCTVDGIHMSEWSVVIHTDKGADDKSFEMYDEKGIPSAVYDYRNTINVWVEVAIFSESTNQQGAIINPGRVALYWEAQDEYNNRTPFIRKEPRVINLNNKGCGRTDTFEIRTSGGNGLNYIMEAPCDVKNLEDGEKPYNEPYKISAIYERADNFRYTASSPTPDPNKPNKNFADSGDIRDASSTVVNGDSLTGITGWFDNKMLIINRPIVAIGMTEGYRGTARTYDGKSIAEPQIGRDVTFTPDDTDDEQKEFTWYQGTRGEVELAVETGNVTGLELVDWKDTDSSDNTGGTVSPSNVETPEGPTKPGTYPPKNAGFYVLEVKVEPTRTTMGGKEYWMFIINPRPVNVRGTVGLSKTYGEEDPDWSGSGWYTTDNMVEGDVLIGQIDRELGENVGTYLVTRGSLRNDNYTVNFTPGRFKVEPRQLEWDNEYLFMVTQDGFSVVGGLGLKYTAEENDDELIEELWANDDVSLTIARLNQSADSNKVTIDAPELVGKAKDNYVLTLDRAVELLPENKFKLTVKKGIDSETPKKLMETISALDTEEKVKAAMEDAVVSQGAGKRNVSVYDIILMNADGSYPTEEQKEKILQTGLTVTLPYPAGTAKDTHSFVAAHMFTEEINTDGGVKSAGYIEKPKTERTDDGIRIQVASLSPVSVGWNTMQGFNPDSPNGGNNNGNNNGTNGGDGNNGTNGGTNNGTNGGTNNGTNSGNNNNNGTNNNGTDNKTNGTTNNTNKTGTTSTTKTTGVKTGDQAQIAFYMITTLIACLLLILIIFLIRVQFRKKD